MTAEYVKDIEKYNSKPDEAVVKSIVRYCGIALRNKDSSYVAVSDDKEVKRVVDGFCAKKLGLDAATAEAAVKKVGERMKADRTKHRVTVYYLVAEETNTLDKLR